MQDSLQNKQACQATASSHRRTRLSQSRLETLATSMPQLRNTDQGECVITRASYKQDVNKASAPSNRFNSTTTRLSQSRLETLATSMPQLRNTDQGECVITRASYKQDVNKASAASNRIKSAPTRLSPILKHLQHQCRSSGTRTKVSVSSHEPLTKRQQSKRTKQPCQVSANKAQSVPS